jgi:hypothetical protein
MSIDRRITNGLAWAGVLLVVGVPTADLLSAQFIGAPATPASVQVAVVERIAPVPAPASQRPAAPVAKPPVQVAVASPKPVVSPVVPAAKPVAAPVAAAVAPTAKPTVTPAAETADAVDAFLQSGRSLPSYITGAGAPVAPSQVATTPPARTPIITTPAAIDPVEVAAIPPQKVAPMPMPLSMRPEPVSVALVQEQPLIVVPTGLTPASPAVIVRPPANVTAADLDDWETGPLSDFLAERQAGNAYVDPGVDANGFFLDQGPNRRQRDRVIAREVDDFFLFD